MSRNAEEVQRQAEEIRRKRLEATGLADQYDLWRESMPNARIPDNEAYDTFVRSQVIEDAAIEGRLSVSTGGTEDVLGTDIPTPGPDAEEDSPDGPGDTSKGGEGRDTDLKLVEGMWLPPEESQAENYKEPSTYQISRSSDWVRDAKILHEFMGSPNKAGDRAAVEDKFGSQAFAPDQLMSQKVAIPMGDEQIGEWARNELSGFNWNVVNTMDYAHKIMSADDPKIALAFLNLINMYDHSDGGATEFGGALGEIATDPTTYLGLGLGSVAAKGTAKLVAKTGLKKAIQLAIVGGSAGAVEGGMLAGGFDLTVQNVEQEAGAREDIDYGRAAIATGAGTTLGTLLGSGGGHFVGRRMDKFAAAVEAERLRLAGGTKVLGKRAGQELGEKELMEMLQASQQASEKAGTRDVVAEMANKILGDDGSMPRLEDGSMDWDKITGIIDEVNVKHAKVMDDPEAGTLKQREGGKQPDPLPLDESRKLQEKVAEMQELEKGEVVMRTATRPGSRVAVNGVEHEVVGRTKNGWYHLRDQLGRQVNKRRKQFDVLEKAPAPKKAGPMELDPFSRTAAKIVAMNEAVVSGKLKEVKTTHAEQAAIVKDLQELGVDITEKKLSSHWAPSELMFLRNTYNAQALGMADIARRLESQLRNEGRLLDTDLAMFNQAHAQFVATRDLFYGVSGNAARQLNILRSRPTDDVYNFGQSLMDSISMQGGRANTERAIRLMADFARKADEGGAAQGISRMSESIWGNQKAAAILNVRYNMMLSSWRTHFFNFLGNSASGVYQHLMVSPVKMGINNANYASQLAWSRISGNAPDPADRLTRHQWYAELRGHYSGFRDSLSLAKEIAMGRDIGEGKVWNELGLRYNVINVPDSAFAKLGTTPVRALEAGDAFFKNQYYNSKIHELASIQARHDEVYNNWNYKERYQFHVDNPEQSVQQAAQAFATKQTYTNDPNIYGGVLAALAKGVSTAQNKSLVVNMIVPFVRTPANLLSYSMEMIGANIVLSAPKTFNAIMHGTQHESQEALARLTIAAGLWLAVAEMHQNGDITGTGPSNWEEKKAWEAAGWQANSVKIHGTWYDISRAAPAGQSLATIASVFDFYSMTRQQDKPTTEWIGAGLLYTADMIIDDSYLSTASDFITAISSKEESRARSSTASMITSILVPNLLRDFRRPADEVIRSTTSVNLLDQVQKQMMNSSPWHSADLPPKRDWKGEPVNYYGNAYTRALVPFNMRDAGSDDMASMAVAYARIPVATPNKQIAWPGGNGDGIDLFAMDEGDGFVYDRYVQITGERRLEAVNILVNTPEWKSLIKDENVGPGSEGEGLLKTALGIGSKNARLEMLGFLIEHSGDNSTYKRNDGNMYQIQHQVSVDEYIRLREMIRNERIDQPEGTEQFKIKKRQQGPEFFKP